MFYTSKLGTYFKHWSTYTVDPLYVNTKVIQTRNIKVGPNQKISAGNLQKKHTYTEKNA